MKTVFFAIAAMLAATGVSFAMDADSQGVAERYKSGKPMAIADVATLMVGSERWCYGEDETGCDWTDIYLDVGAKTVEYEIANAWSVDYDIAFTDRGEFREGRYICESGYEWVPTIRATRRSDGTVVGGRELAGLKREIGVANSGEIVNCFDYLFLSVDENGDTITLLQRQYDPDGTHTPADDIAVTLHFDAGDAEALALKW